MPIPRVHPDRFARPTPHPGVFLSEDFLPDYGLTAGSLARRMGIARPRMERIVRGQGGITADTALRLAAVFGTTAEYWMQLQALHDLTTAQAALAGELAQIERMSEPALA